MSLADRGKFMGQEPLRVLRLPGRCCSLHYTGLLCDLSAPHAGHHRAEVEWYDLPEPIATDTPLWQTA